MNTTSSLLLPWLFLLSSCSTLNEKECHTADWLELGVQDGRAGLPEKRLDDYAKSCKKYGIHPDINQYLDGRKTGLKHYCVPSNAFRTGIKGEEYKGVCPPEMDMAFHINNAAARKVYQARQKIQEVDSSLSRKEHELSENDTSEKERLRLRKEIRDLDRERDRLKSELHFEERELDFLMEEERYRNTKR